MKSSEREELAKLLYESFTGIDWDDMDVDQYGQVADSLLPYIQQRVDAAVTAERERCATICAQTSERHFRKAAELHGEAGARRDDYGYGAAECAAATREGEPACADCGRPRNDSRMHFEAPGTNWGAALHNFREGEKPRPTPSHYHAHPDGTFTICDCAGEKP